MLRVHSKKIMELSKGYYCTNGRFSVSYENIVTFLYNQGMFVRQAFDSLSDEVHKKAVYMVRDFILVIVEGIIDI